MAYVRRRGTGRVGRNIVLVWIVCLTAAAARDRFDQEREAASALVVASGDGPRGDGEAGRRPRGRRRLPAHGGIDADPRTWPRGRRRRRSPPPAVAAGGDGGGGASRGRRRRRRRRNLESLQLGGDHGTGEAEAEAGGEGEAAQGGERPSIITQAEVQQQADPRGDTMPAVDDDERERLERLERLSRERDYLNGLVAKSAEATRQQVCNVAFLKTHKTASTTMAMILVRYARRHDKKLASFGGDHVSAIPLEEAVQQIQRSGVRVDVMHYHYTISGFYDGRWPDVESAYERIMQKDERINYITVLRNPRSHFLSYYYYYVQPEAQLSVIHFFGSKRKDEGFQQQRKRLWNPLCSEFGIHNAEDLEVFIKQQLGEFRLVLLTERFDEGLMVLRRLMGWDLIDFTYSKMMETVAGTQRWDGKMLKSVPHWDDLPVWVQESIDASTNLDRILYEAAESYYIKVKAAAAVEIQADLKEFEELQKIVNSYLHENTTSSANHWYSSSAEPYLGGEEFSPF